MRAPAALLALGALLAGCLGDAPCADAPAGPLDVGAGDLDTGYVPVSDGEPMQIVLGPQGMHMIVVSARVHGTAAPAAGETTHLEVGIYHGDAVVGGTIVDVEPRMDTNAVAEYLGLRAIFTVAEVRPLAGELADIVVRTSDQCGGGVQGRRTVELTMEPEESMNPGQLPTARAGVIW